VSRIELWPVSRPQPFQELHGLALFQRLRQGNAGLTLALASCATDCATQTRVLQFPLYEALHSPSQQHPTMSDLRFLAPRPPGAATPQADSGSVARKSKVAVACESCRLKRIKVCVPFTSPRCRLLGRKLMQPVRWRQAAMPRLCYTRV
jgi:hypothetical protein